MFLIIACHFSLVFILLVLNIIMFLVVNYDNYFVFIYTDFVSKCFSVNAMGHFCAGAISTFTINIIYYYVNF